MILFYSTTLCLVLCVCVLSLSRVGVGVWLWFRHRGEGTLASDVVQVVFVVGKAFFKLSLHIRRRHSGQLPFIPTKFFSLIGVERVLLGDQLPIRAKEFAHVVKNSLHLIFFCCVVLCCLDLIMF